MPARDKAPTTPPPRDRSARQTQRAGQSGSPTESTDRLISPQDVHAAPPRPTQSDAEVTHFATPPQGSYPAGARLREMRRRSGLSAAALAAALEMKPTTYKSIEDRSKKPHLELPLAERIARLLAGRGQPPITQADVLALAGVVAPTHNSPYISRPPFNARVEGHGPAITTVTPNVPVVPASQSRWGIMAVIITGQPVAWLPRPPSLASNRAVFAVTIQDASLAPRYEPGERVYCDPSRPPSVGCYAVVLTNERDSDGAQLALAGRVDAITAAGITIAQIAPPATIDVPADNIATMARILTTAELLGA